MDAVFYIQVGAVKIVAKISRPTEPQSFVGYAREEQGKEVLNGVESISILGMVRGRPTLLRKRQLYYLIVAPLIASLIMVDGCGCGCG